MTTLRDRYADALLHRLEEHTGPVSDAVVYMERLDLLAGVDLEMKRLSAPAGDYLEAVAAVPPIVIEHGAEAPESDEGSTVAEYSAPVVHEEAQQAERQLDSTPVVDTPAAPSPGARVPCIDCGNPSAKGKDRCRSCAGKVAWTPERREAQRKAALERRQRLQNPATVATQTPRPAPQEPLTPPAAVETPAEPARGLSNVVALPAVEPAPQCYCAGYRAHVDGFRQDIANEAHAKNCPMYRVGGHKWPLPRQGQDEEPPYVVSCTWCRETREVDRTGVEWSKSESNPAVTRISPYAKNVTVPA